MQDILAEIKKRTEENFEDVVSIRRHLHAHPELSFKEHETSAFIRRKLLDMGVEVKDGYVGTGLVGLIHGTAPGKVVALRADMDALPILEENDVEYRSVNNGVMHACGHDVHSASLLGAAMILQDMRTAFEGTVKLIFQPGEEKLPGGASLMINEGVLEDPVPDVIIGQHVMPGIEVGRVGFRPGMYMASADELYITVKGKGGHAAMPENNVDPIIMASKIRLALEEMVRNRAKQDIPTVLGIGKMEANGATNVVPDEVRMEGTFRTMDEEWRSEAHELMVKTAQGITSDMGGACDFHVEKGYPYLVNHEELTQRNMEAACSYLGEDYVEDMDIRMTAEDFAFFSQHAEASFYRLGTRNTKRGITSQLHTSTFNVDEDALKIGMGLMAWLAYSELQQ